MLRSLTNTNAPSICPSEGAPDADLIRLGREFEKLHDQMLTAAKRSKMRTGEARRVASHLAGVSNPPLPGEAERFVAHLPEAEQQVGGVDELMARWERLSNQVGALIDRIWLRKPTSIEGAQVYARVGVLLEGDFEFSMDRDFGRVAALSLARIPLSEQTPQHQTESARVTATC